MPTKAAKSAKPAPAPSAASSKTTAPARAAAPVDHSTHTPPDAATDAAAQLVLVLGDQLWMDNPALRALNPATDTALMIEAPGESTHVWSSKPRTAVFLSAMRHFAAQLRAAGTPLVYTQLADWPETPGLIERLGRHIDALQPKRLVLTEPGDYRLRTGIEQLCRARKLPVVFLADTHFMCTLAEFADWAAGYKQLRMEFFYRMMRKRHGVLMDEHGERDSKGELQPLGGQWNYDAENREGFPKTGPGAITPPATFAPDEITQGVFADIERVLPKHPGELGHFIWPVTREQALQALAQFIEHRLPRFGPTQDAMWTDTPFAWHALLSSSLNLHLLDPREVIEAAEAAHRSGRVDLASAEGFIRQILGWREFIRGVYWLKMPGLAQANHYQHTRTLPAWYWTGQTNMACMRAAVGQTLKYGYAHHIQRLMVTGQFGILAEIEPQQVCDWYLAVYVDAIDWVELPNVAGMALYADGGSFVSKPYVASGQYIKRMSNYCEGCAYKPDVKTGPRACPVSTLYWHFLHKHEAVLAKNPRTALMAKSIGRLEPAARQAIVDEAQRMLNDLDAL